MKNFIKSLFILIFIVNFSGFAQTPSLAIVEGGSIEIGSSDKDFKDEQPVHKVTVSSFYISRYEISYDNYSDFCNFAGMEVPNGKKSYPVTGISWENAVMYCNWLSNIEMLTSCYTIERKGNKFIVTCDFSAAGYRLPTEAEWEYAAKGGVRSKEFLFSGSNNPFVVAWFAENSKKKQHKSGELEPNELGIYDMTGNVSEWCWDFYDKNYYKTSPINNPKGQKIGQKRVYKGGNGKNKLIFSKISRRFSKLPTETDPDIGFRVVRKM